MLLVVCWLLYIVVHVCLLLMFAMCCVVFDVLLFVVDCWLLVDDGRLLCVYCVMLFECLLLVECYSLLGVCCCVLCVVCCVWWLVVGCRKT